MPLNCGVGEDSWQSLGHRGDQTSRSYRKSIWNTHWKDWYWSWNSSILVTWRKQLTHWKSPWCWEILRAEGEESIRGWDGWMASPVQWTWTWANSKRWWGMKWPGVLQSMKSQRAGGSWRTEHHQQHPKVFCFGISIILNCRCLKNSKGMERLSLNSPICLKINSPKGTQMS